MRWNIGDDIPRIGEVLRRRDSDEWARVDYIAEPGRPLPFACTPLCIGDVVLNVEPGRDIITSGGSYFWEKWERPDSKHLLSLAFAVGCNPRA